MHIVIVGAGAAGLMAAASAAQSLRAQAAGGRVTLLDKNRKAGVKILMSGGTRCNITHDCGPDGIMQAFGRNGRFLRDALYQLPPSAVIELFHQLGVPTQVESTGKIFPVSNRALDVRDALLRRAIEAGAQLQLGVAVQSVTATQPGWSIQTESGELIADRLIITSGGRSYPGCGTTGDGYRWLEQLGHSIVPPRPALVPLVGGLAWHHALSGLTLEHVVAEVRAAAEPGQKVSKRPHIARHGSFLFTHQGYSGPAAMDVSGTITAGGDPARTRLTLDLAPDRSPQQIDDWFEAKRRAHGGRKVLNVLSEWLPRRLAEGLLENSHCLQSSFAELPRKSQLQLVEQIKQLPLPVHGTRGFEKAEVTAGGVSLREVDPRTMASRLVPDLMIAGEILDLDGWIGGYNFQSAFSTGHLAGLHAARPA
jgi:predicted Rossmann fold flavoprotein